MGAARPATFNHEKNWFFVHDGHPHSSTMVNLPTKKLGKSRRENSAGKKSLGVPKIFSIFQMLLPWMDWLWKTHQKIVHGTGKSQREPPRESVGYSIKATVWWTTKWMQLKHISILSITTSSGNHSEKPFLPSVFGSTPPKFHTSPKKKMMASWKMIVLSFLGQKAYSQVYGFWQRGLTNMKTVDEQKTHSDGSLVKPRTKHIKSPASKTPKRKIASLTSFSFQLEHTSSHLDVSLPKKL